MHLSSPGDGHLPEQLGVINRGPCGELDDAGLVGPTRIQRIGNRLGNRHLMQDVAQLIQR
jgi:hypothetical protein